MTTKNFIRSLNQAFGNEGEILIRDFFVTFSRFECALKASNFAIGDENKVSANWDAFIASIRQTFNKEKSENLKEAVDYLLQNPPKVQMFDNAQLGWRSRVFQANEPEINKLSLSIRDIRNNLFHGGKFNGTYEPELSRNYVLLQNSMIILNDWLSLNDRVKNAFSEPIA